MTSRIEQILNYLKAHNLVVVEELVKVTGASASTIRRELNKLAQTGTITKVHGGASLNRYIAEQTSVEDSFAILHDKKTQIAKRAVKLIKPKDAVVFDAGSTVREIAKLVPDIELKVFTPDLYIGLLMTKLSKVEVTVTGGVVDKLSQSCEGEVVHSMLTEINPSICFLGCNGWYEQEGAMTPRGSKVSVKRNMLKNAKTKVLVATSDKYGVTALHKICDLKEFNLIITDKGLPLSVAQSIQKQGITVIRV